MAKRECDVIYYLETGNYSRKGKLKKPKKLRTYTAKSSLKELQIEYDLKKNRKDFGKLILEVTIFGDSKESTTLKTVVARFSYRLLFLNKEFFGHELFNNLQKKYGKSCVYTLLSKDSLSLDNC